MKDRKKILVLMAAGSGVRMGASLPKQFLELAGKPVLQRSMEIFLDAVPDIQVITVLPKEYFTWWKEKCLAMNFTCPQLLVAGGITRFHSVRNALLRIREEAIVAIHDGVRPLVSPELLERMFARMESGSCRALIPVIPSVDTLKVLDWKEDTAGNRTLSLSDETVDRNRIWGAQTPQLFLSEDIRAAYSQPYDTVFTDDASVAVKKGIPLSFCLGERYNIKLTTPEDFALAERLQANPSFRNSRAYNP
jgi:2-C-methyl-D-erythritol 4-phosphate cytidylyltransferase